MIDTDKQDAAGRMATLLARIEEAYPALTAVNQALARYIVDHHRELAFAPVSRVAEAAGTSPATIVRFAEHFGLSGYAELQSMAQDALREEVDTVRLLERRSSAIDTQSLLGLALSADIANLERAASSIPEATVAQAVEIVAGARTVHLIGLRSTYAQVQHLAFYLGWIGHSARILAPGIGDLPERLLEVEPGDAVIAFSFRRYTRQTVEIFAAAKAAGATAIAISDSPLSPLAEHADLVLSVPVEFPAFFESRTAVMSVINALVFGIAVARRRSTIAALKRHEGAWSSHGTYTSAEVLRRFNADVAAFEVRARAAGRAKRKRPPAADGSSRKSK